ncbi:MAG: ribosome-binding factor A [Alpinimonas sp.]|jgi:ribosome-binding factor A
MVDHARARKLGERIKVIVAEALERGVVKDTRMGFVTITDVRCTGDLQHATIFYTVYGSDEERAETQAALKANTGRIRGEVGRNLTIRLTPVIEFMLDALPENAQSINDLLEKAREQDSAVEGLAKNAAYAGEADPYVKPREIHEEEPAPRVNPWANGVGDDANEEKTS